LNYTEYTELTGFGKCIIEEPMTIDCMILEAALVGYQAQTDTLDKKIADVRNQLRMDGGGGDIPTPFAKPQRKRRKMSAAARKRIGEATKKRWAAFRKAKAS